MMSIDSIKSSELYTIRAKRQEQTENIRQAQEQSQAKQTQSVAEADTYDKDNPVGVQAEGVYSLSHDEEGNLTVNYVKPSAKSDDIEETQSSAKSEAAPKSEPSAGAAQAVSSTSSNDDEELEELQQQRDAIRQQLNRETDENVKAQLRVQLQNIETQIALKSAGVEA